MSDDLSRIERAYGSVAEYYRSMEEEEEECEDEWSNQITDRTIDAVNKLKASCMELLEVWYRSEPSDVINADESTEAYPFDMSFDEMCLKVCEWAQVVTDLANQKKGEQNEQQED